MSAAADLVITGADVYTMDAARRWADAVAIRDDRVVAVGTERDVKDRFPDAREVLHVPGRMVLPAFHDSHVHAPFAGRYRLHVSLHDLPGVDAYRDAVATYAREHADEPWIFGGGWLMAHFPGGAPTKDLLDDIVPDRPVFLMNRDVHGAWVNSKALELGHVTRETPDPRDGRIERDPATGEPTGTLHEGAAYSFADEHLPPPSREEWERAILLAQAHLHSLGIAGWQDAWVTPATEGAYRSLAERGALTARVVGALWWDRNRGLDQVEELVARRDRGSVGTFHPTSAKIMCDGVLENHTGALLRPYRDPAGHETDERGLAFLEREPLSEAVTALDREGFQIHMHAIGDRAVRNALDACEAAREENGARDARHHIAHLQVIDPDDVPRFRELGVVANCQPYWAQHDPQMDELTIPYLGPDRARLQYPFGSLHSAGATLAFGSDWSVSTANPLEEIEVATRRADPSARDADAFLPEQRLPLHVALAAFTSGSCYVNHDDDAGRIEQGARADLVVLDRNVFDAEDGTVADARVEHTIVAGRPVPRAAD
ncbi:MAG TPA: amidohydrolase [Actinomycetota bacterium]|nr:amidohydrolase [Actinomycetota bacterium]